MDYGQLGFKQRHIQLRGHIPHMLVYTNIIMKTGYTIIRVCTCAHNYGVEIKPPITVGHDRFAAISLALTDVC